MDDNVLTLDNDYQEDVDLEGEVYAVGERGYSAYEIALQNGYVGTEEEWLASLVGATPDIDIGTVESGETASATITGTPEEPLLNLVLPKGDKGDKGDTGRGIASVRLLSILGLRVTYRMTFTDGTYFDWNVTNGKSIRSVEKTASSGLVDTYTITYNDNTTSTFTVTNGADGTTPTIGDNGNWYLGDEDTGKPSRGEQGVPGEAGPAGEGVPAGGTAGQVLSKIDGTDYNTQWITAPTPDMNNYYTKSEVDNIVEDNNRKYFTYDSSMTNAEKIAFFQEWVDYYLETGDYNSIIFYGSSRNLGLAEFKKLGNVYSFGFIAHENVQSYTTSVQCAGIMVSTNNDNVVTSVSGGTVYSYTMAEKYVSGGSSSGALPANNTASFTPTGAYNPATKKYVDDITGALTDLDTTDKTSLVNAINEVVAGSGGGSSDAVKVLFLDDYSSSSNALDMSKFETGIYIILRKSSGNTLYMKPRAGAYTSGLQNATGSNYLTMLIYTNQLPETYDYNSRSFTIYQLNPNFYSYWTYTDTGTDFSRNWSTAVEGVDLSSNQTITGTKTFSTLPVSSTTPTASNQLVNKQYVDTAISNAITSALGGSY